MKKYTTEFVKGSVAEDAVLGMDVLQRVYFHYESI